jgi:polyhydroxyalkanoate synthesis regulator phasin
MPDSNPALASAIAGGAIAAALIETLLDKGILTLDESRAVLDRVMRTIGAHSRDHGAFEAMRIIGGLQSGRFTARGTTP